MPVSSAQIIDPQQFGFAPYGLLNIVGFEASGLLTQLDRFQVRGLKFVEHGARRGCRAKMEVTQFGHERVPQRRPAFFQDFCAHG